MNNQPKTNEDAIGQNLKTRKIVYYIFGVLETLLAFRFVFKLLGANPGSTFVSMIYKVSGIFMAPFLGIFRNASTQGIETTAYFEAATLIAIAVYAIIAYGIVRMIEISNKPKNQERI